MQQMASLNGSDALSLPFLGSAATPSDTFPHNLQPLSDNMMGIYESHWLPICSPITPTEAATQNLTRTTQSFYDMHNSILRGLTLGHTNSQRAVNVHQSHFGAGDTRSSSFLGAYLSPDSNPSNTFLATSPLGNEQVAASVPFINANALPAHGSYPIQPEIVGLANVDDRFVYPSLLSYVNIFPFPCLIRT